MPTSDSDTSPSAPVAANTTSQNSSPASTQPSQGKVGDFMKAVQKKLLELYNPTSGQTFAVQFPGRFLQEDLYAWDTDQFSKPVVVNESEFRLVDQLYDVGQVVGAPNGSNLSIIYEEILNNLVPGFESSELERQQDKIRQWLLKDVPAAPWVKDLLKEQHQRAGTSTPDDSNGSFAVANKLTEGGKVNRMELAEALMKEYLRAKSAWELDRDKMIRETKPEDLEDFTRTLADITAVRKAELSAKYADAVVLGHSHTVRQYLGYLDITSPAKMLQDAKDAFRESSASSLDGSMKVFPVQMSPVDWFRGLSTSFSLEDLTSNPDMILIEIDAKSKKIDALQTRLAFLQGTPTANLQELKQKLDAAQSTNAQAEADLSSTYNANVVSIALTCVSPSGDFLMSEFMSAAHLLKITASLYNGIEDAMKKVGDGQVAVVNASRAYTTLLSEVAAAKATDNILEEKELTMQITSLQSDVTELTTHLKFLRFDASGALKTPKDPKSVTTADVPILPPNSASNGSRWQDVTIHHETSNMFSMADQSSSAYSEDSGLSFFFGGSSDSSSNSSADSSSHFKQTDFKMDIGFRATMVTADRSGWFQPQFFQQSAGFYHIDQQVSWSKWPESVNGARDLQNATADVWDALNKYLMPAFPVGYVICKDITIKVSMDSETHDSDSTVFQSHTSSSSGVLLWSTSSSSSSSSAHQKVYTQETSDGFVIRIPGPQIIGYMFEIMPNDLTTQLPETIPS